MGMLADLNDNKTTCVSNETPNAGARHGEPSEVVRARVEAAMERQRVRFTGTDIAANADMRPADVRNASRARSTRWRWV